MAAKTAKMCANRNWQIALAHGGMAGINGTRASRWRHISA